MQQSIRYVFVDILKGIAILLIVYGHIIPGAIPLLTKWVSTFHIPLFFFVSGLLYNENKYKNNFIFFVKERSKGLVLPFVLFSAIVAIGYKWVVVDYKSFLSGLFTAGWGGDALWFIPVLLATETMFYPISKIKEPAIVLGLILCAVLSYVSAQNIGLISNNLLLTFCGIYYYGFGYLCRPLLGSSEKIDARYKVFFFIVGLLLSFIYIPICNTLPQWFVNDIPSIVFYISPLFAIFCMITMSSLIEQYANKYIIHFFAYCGRYSLIILAFHQIICMIVGRYLPSKITIITMIVQLTFLVWFIPKYTPWMLGKSKH